MKTVTIGFIREDGDIQVLATLNNNDDTTDEVHFRLFVAVVKSNWQRLSGENVEVFERQDAPDYVTPEGESKMKTFEVEFKRTSFTGVEVEAKDAEEAESLAWQEIPDRKDANWEIESITDTSKDDDLTLDAANLMIALGGSFAAAIGSVWIYGDRSNRQRVYAAFEDLFEKYETWAQERGENK